MTGITNVKVQVETQPGVWMTAVSGSFGPQGVVQAMQNAQRIHRGKRVRAVDQSGRLVDML